jgi:hypothetical protein
LKNIAVRVRGNQVFCIDVRLRQAPHRGESQAARAVKAASLAASRPRISPR